MAGLLIIWIFSWRRTHNCVFFFKQKTAYEMEL